MSRASEAIAHLREAWRTHQSGPAAQTTAIGADQNPSPGQPGQWHLMPERLEQLGLDPEFVRHAEPDVYRELERVCATCTAWHRCKQDLARGDVQAGMDSYCLNAARIDALTVDCHAPQ